MISNKHLKIRDDEKIEISDVLLNHEELKNHAIEIAKKHEIFKSQGNIKSLLSRLDNNFKIIGGVYQHLNEDVKKKKNLSSASEWLLDNFYKIEEQVKVVRQELIKEKFLKLSILNNGFLKGYPRVYAIGLELVSHTDSRVDEDTLIDFIKAYQSEKVLSIAEIWSLSLIIRSALIEKIRNICEKIQDNQIQWEKAEKMNGKDIDEILDGIKEEFEEMEAINSSYIEHLLKNLRKEEVEYGKVKDYIEKKLLEFDTTIDRIIKWEHKEEAARKISIGNAIIALNIISTLDWNDIFESLSQVEEILKNDPSGIYKKMDFESRDYYRSQIEKISKKCNVSEIRIARKTIEYAQEARNKNEEDKLKHVGHYIIGKGKEKLLSEFEYNKKYPLNDYPISIYLAPIIILTSLITLFFASYAYNVSNSVWKSLLGLIVTLIPSSEIAVILVNWAITHIIPPSFLPKLEYKDGIPVSVSTMVVIPTLLPTKKCVEELLEKIEVYYQGNKEKNLYFALVGDFRDGENKVSIEDEIITKTALEGIKKLNKKYAEKEEIFFYFHRHRQYCQKQNKWMGWERKRGALVELNELLGGSKKTSYSIISGDITSIVEKIKYVITIDADTNLPMDTAKKLIGTISHPLNKAVVDVKKGIVTEGYGLIQPRIGLDIESANNSFFTRVFAGQGGIDSYTTAISDVYQDLFGEGIFTGKGIYELETFNKIVKDAIPDNTVLSHDLLEGSYVRVGLATDIELIDGYPSKYSSFMSRLHRWVRGDWQLIKWMSYNNPLSILSKWKIFDNMRRSLVSISLSMLIILGLTFLPGKSYVWIGLSILTISFQLIMEFTNCILFKHYKSRREKISCNVVYGMKSVFYQVLFLFIFLPYQGYMMGDAIIRTLYRVFISNKNLLEWVTASDVEKKLKNNQISFVKRMYPGMFISFVFFTLVFFIKPENLGYATVITLIWIASPIVAYRISKEEVIERKLNKDDIKVLRRIGRKTWAYYEDFSGEEENYLPVDNYQEDPPNGLAHRTSPTNIGFLLLAILSARDLGYISITQMIDKVHKTLSTIENMENWKGHLFNWYDTRTLEVLRPFYVSTVDSGNFVGYLITLKQGLLEYTKNPILDKKLLLGIKDTLELMNKEESLINNLLDKDKIEMKEWKNLIEKIILMDDEGSEWAIKLKNTIRYLKKEIDELILHIEKEDSFEVLRDKLSFIETYSLIELKVFYENILYEMDELLKDKIRKKEEKENLLKIKNNMMRCYKNVEEILDNIDNLVNRIDKIVDNTDFSYLYDNKRHLFAIGYDVQNEKLTNSYYDLLASEARLASYIAIARKQIPKKHWFKLGRALSIVDGYRGLVSWTATMFEYFMPPLVMKNYKNTLLDETYNTVIKAQKKYADKRKVPWGTSESGYYGFDMLLNYQYKAFGVPDIGLKRGLIKDMVISPYSTILALPFDEEGAMDNMKRLIRDEVEGKYGFYEAIDYTPERMPKDKKRMIVKSYMAHHQGMSILALNNYLNSNVMQDRFHMDPIMKSGEVLLQEKVPVRVIITKEYKDTIEPLEELEKEDTEVIRTYGVPEDILPKCHILSNGRYFVMITESGNGYSKKEDIQLTRWREDALTGKHGQYIFIKNLNVNKLWSATYAPIYTEPHGYKVNFLQDKAEFIRVDDNIDTHTEIIVSPEDNVEIRKVTLTNHGMEDALMELTSYFETVLTHQGADIAHPAFSNLFIRTEALLEYDTLIASRRPRLEGKDTIWMLHTITVEGEIVGNLQYESNRSNFIGRSKNISNPIGLTQSLSNTSGPVLDPIMSLRRKIKVDAGKSAVISFITGIGKSKGEVVELAKKYHDNTSINRAFQFSYTRNQVENMYLNFKMNEIKTYQDMISHIVFLSPHRRKYEDMFKQNVKGQSALWAYGISGDIPIVLISIKSEDYIDIVIDALRAHEYWRMKGLRVDLLILNEDESNYFQPLQEMIRETVCVKYGNDILDKSGGVFIRNAKIMPQEDYILFYTVARMILRGEEGSISSQIKMKNSKKEDIQEKVFKEKTIVYTSKEEPLHLNLDYFNGYGGFSKNGKEYVIQLKDKLNTPAPWINVVSNEKFGFQVSESGAGFVWAENSRENKLTPWSNDPVTDIPGEVIYLRDEEDGDIWTITPLPIRKEERYTIKHGLGYSTFNHESKGINQELTMFVPINESIKISMVKLKNNSPLKRKLALTYYLKPVLGVSDQSTQQYICTDIDEESGTFLIKNSYNTDFPARIAFMDASENIKDYTGNREAFLGSKGDLYTPEGLKKERLSNEIGAGLDPCGAIQIIVEMQEQEEKEMVFLFGQSKDKQEMVSLIEKYKDINNCKNALKEVQDKWEKTLGKIQVKTPDLSMDLLMNYWLLYQNISCRIWARSAFYQSGGAFGFRDQLQDSMNALYALPETTRNQILLHCAHQFIEGDVQHWWHPGAGEKGIRTKFSDDLLWLPYVTAEYIYNTGDETILDEQVHFLEGEPLGEEDEKYSIPRISNEKASVYEHCIRAIERGIKFGEHNIPLMGCGDWNDGMSTVGNKGKGESVWLGWFMYNILMKFSSLCATMKDFEREKRYIKIAKEMANAIEENAWDGEWYKRAYFDDGTPLGSIKNPECMIDSLAQSWSIISGVGREDRTKGAMESVKQYLIKEEEGMILLFTPPFDDSDLQPGYIKGYVPGVRENGGQYTHAATWVINAFALMGDGDMAWKLYHLINPINHTRTSIECSKYKVEPYVMAADVYSTHPHIGRGGWTWYTGAAGWMYKVGLENILGLRKNKDKLIIDPCIPKDWNEYTMKYKYKNTSYNIMIKNPEKVNRNVKSIVLDGKEVEYKHITLVDDHMDHNIEVFLGK